MTDSLLKIVRKREAWFKPSFGQIFEETWPTADWTVNETKPETIKIKGPDGKLVETDEEFVLVEQIIWRSEGSVPTSEQILAAGSAAWLSAAKKQAKRMVDRQAEGERLQFLTPGVGQAMVYMEKLEEARAWERGEEGDFPLLRAEDRPIAAVVADVLKQAAAWKAAAADIEGRRLGAKREIEAAANVDAVEAALVARNWLAI